MASFETPAAPLVFANNSTVAAVNSSAMVLASDTPHTSNTPHTSYTTVLPVDGNGEDTASIQTEPRQPFDVVNVWGIGAFGTASTCAALDKPDRFFDMAIANS